MTRYNVGEAKLAREDDDGVGKKNRWMVNAEAA